MAEMKEKVGCIEQDTPLVRRKIGSTTYLVRVHFNSDSKETLQQKIQRMLANEVQSMELNSQIESNSV